MSNVRIKATGEIGLSVAVNLGPNERASHICPAGESIELTVGGNQTLSIAEIADAPTAEAEVVEVGVDVAPDAVPDAAPAEAAPAENTVTEDAAEPITDSPLEVGEAITNPFAADK